MRCSTSASFTRGVRSLVAASPLCWPPITTPFPVDVRDAAAARRRRRGERCGLWSDPLGRMQRRSGGRSRAERDVDDHLRGHGRRSGSRPLGDRLRDQNQQRPDRWKPATRRCHSGVGFPAVGLRLFPDSRHCLYFRHRPDPGVAVHQRARSNSLGGGAWDGAVIRSLWLSPWMRVAECTSLVVLRWLLPRRGTPCLWRAPMVPPAVWFARPLLLPITLR